MKTASPPRISAIVAMSKNRVIGHNKQLPWRLPADLKRFKTITSGHPVIMGRKTFESIGKPLPNRTNIVLTRFLAFQASGCLTVHTPHQAMQQAAQSPGGEEIFVIGGAEIYQLFLPNLSRIYLTEVHQTIAGDTFFPELNTDIWQERERVSHSADADNPYAYSFVILEKRS